MSCAGIFDFDKLEKELEAFEVEMSAPEFWDDKDRAQAKVGEVAALKNKVIPVRELDARIEDFSVLVELAAEEDDAAAALEEVKGELEEIETELDKIELQTLLNGPNDKESAFLTIHAGAGGTEACGAAAEGHNEE